ncbi:HlyD family type I secretion periplasmic adaptor subunit [Meridianimarinicoccus marinus]|uniref:HlyD family type I secretion periplasmic adaptor subunit n=1 Tax=Meridianimarinicoccus marinus TaxID=3231483 RepID=UPI003F4F39B6
MEAQLKTAGTPPPRQAPAPKPDPTKGNGALATTAPAAPQLPPADTSAAWSARRPLTLGILVLVVLVGGFGGWAVFTEIAGAIIASGRIEVDQNRQVVQHLDGGIVDEILVDEGDRVASGDILIHLDDSILASELSIVEGQLYELMARRGRLEAEQDGLNAISYDPILLQVAATRPEVANLMRGQQRLFEARTQSLAREIEQLGKRRAQISSQIEGIEAQQDALARQLELMKEEVTDAETLLAGGLAQKPRLLALLREESRLSGTLGELQASKAEAEGRITEIEIQILGLENTRREEAISRLRDIQSREAELAEQRRALLDRLSRLDIRAPVAGIVYDLQVFAERSVIRPADPVLYIIPQDRPLVIQTRVEPIHIDQVFPGQEVTLRFSALDSRTTPELTGRVTQISADAFTDQSTGFSFYLAELELLEGEIDKLPEGITLLPGMPVEAFLRTDDRTPMAYLVKPLADYFVKAFRES